MKTVQPTLIISIIILLQIATIGCTDSFSPRMSKSQVSQLVQFGIPEIDLQLHSHFGQLGEAIIELERGEKIPLRDFLRMVDDQLNCPVACEAYSFCEPAALDSTIENCEIQWSRLEPQRKDQDLEPGSIWTMEYKRVGSEIVPNSIFAFWKDY